MAPYLPTYQGTIIFIVMQAATMIRFPAPFTLCSVTSLIGAVMTGLFQVATAGRLSPGTPQISIEIILSLVFVVLATATQLWKIFMMCTEMNSY
jgi:hypothetical protein